MNRRQLLQAVPAWTAMGMLAACSAPAREALVDRIKRMSANATTAIDRYAGKLFPDLVQQIKDADAKIQAIAAGDVMGALQTLLPPFISAVQAVLNLIPGGAIPATAIAAIRTVLNFFAGTIGSAGAGPDTGMTVEDADAILALEAMS